MSLGVRSATRRYVGLTALHWLPVGLSAPVTVLLASSRGLSPADVGVVFAVYSAVVLVLELPTGGLADAIGTRPVLVLSALLSTAGLLAVAAADDVVAFALAEGLRGVARALSSGPLEAWYVDAVRAADPEADVTPGLSRAGAADGAGLCLGAVVGGLLPLLTDDAGDGVLVLPVLAAAALALCSVVAVALLVVPVGAVRGSGPAALRAGVREVPAVVRETARMVGRDRLLRRLLAVSLLVGAVLSTLELVGPLHVAELTGSRTEGSAVFGVVMAVSFAAAGVGALLAPAVRRAARGSAAVGTAGLAVVGALAVAAVPLGGPVVLGCLFAVFYVTNAAAWPLWKQVMHGQVGEGRRATALSASSLALQVGALGGTLGLARLAEAAGTGAALQAAGAALVLVAVTSLGLRRGARAPAGAVVR
ncbi:putative MFS family arabinose efflux permease [Geodermatophilus bullaregiensis]|uniref:MFS transporter n=1 Tax=Geodermatophilus bullaregiensis TaxID=1564160 RepID=UPI001956CABE|nr:MFS transporter [Geodermatophilus bullaregiensis]MBM7807862.1 putative MFS family arabinose efflux permease [Geodermatophilus bullaregiensis]